MLDVFMYYLAIGVTIYIVATLIDNFSSKPMLEPSKEFTVLVITLVFWPVLVPMVVVEYYKYYRDKNKLKRKP